jgi:XTP/dITP diphosphohydrolase
MTKLIIATNNLDKLKEIKEIIADVNISLLSARDFADFPEVEETGATLAENALVKARAIWEKYHLACIADDTGLEVDCLGGKPGVYSSRYAGPQASYADNCRKLLTDMAGVPASRRAARFRTVIAFIDDRGAEHIAEGTVAGEILDAPRGQNGFGYDPVFFIPHLNKTLAELSPADKNKISHRHNALVNILPAINTYIRSES